MAMFGIIALFSAIVLFIYLHLHMINPLEKLVYWFCAAMVEAFIFSIWELNLELVTTSNQWLLFLNARLSEFLFHGVGIALCAVVLGSSAMKPAWRCAILLIYLIGYLIIDYLFEQTGVLTFNRWNLWFSCMHFLIVMLFTYLYMLLFRTFLKRVRGSL